MHTPRLPPSRQSVHGPRAYTARKVQFEANVNFLPSRRPASLPDSRTVHPRKHPRLYVHLPVTPTEATRSQNRYGALDSGTTKHMIPEGYTGTDPRPITYGSGPEISCPNGSIMSCVGRDTLDLPLLPPKARECLTVRDLQLPLVSVKQLCRNGLTVQFSGHEVQVHDDKDRLVLRGACGPGGEDLYMVPLRNDGRGVVNLFNKDDVNLEATRTREKAWGAYQIRAVPTLVKYLHACAGFPSKERWIEAIRRNYFQGWPGLTPERARKYLGKVTHTTMGRQRLVKQGVRSTTRTSPEEETPDTPDVKIETGTDVKDEWDASKPLGLGLPPQNQSRKHRVGVFTTEDIENLFADLKGLLKNLKRDGGTTAANPKLEDLKRTISTDQTGRFPVTSARGHKYLFVMYDFDSNYINAIPITSRHEKELIRAWTTCYDDLARAGFVPVLQRMDNEYSKKLLEVIESKNLDYEIAAAGDHRTNPAERAIQTLKDHMIACLNGTDRSFPPEQWDLLMPQIILTLNLVRESRYQPLLSAYAQVHGQFDFNKTPLAPLGCLVIVHDRPKDRGTWADHGTLGFYVGPAMKHYRNYTCYIPATKATRTSNTVEFFPDCCEVPTTSSTDALTMAFQDIKEILENPHPPMPVTNLTHRNEMNESIRLLQKFTNLESITPDDACGESRRSPRTPPVPDPKRRAGSRRSPRLVERDKREEADGVARVPALGGARATPGTQRLLENKSLNNRYWAPPTQYNVGTIIKKRWDNVFYTGTITKYDPVTGFYRIEYEDGDSEDLEHHEVADLLKKTGKQTKRARRQRSACTSVLDRRAMSIPTPKARAYAAGGGIWDNTLGKRAQYRDMIRHPNPDVRAKWLRSGESEFGRLFQGFEPNDIEGKDVLEWIKRSEVPKGKKVTYPRTTIADRPEKEMGGGERFRTRITAGGNLLDYHGSTYTPGASIETVKLHWNSVLSSPGYKYCTGDISNMYLESLLPPGDEEYVKYRYQDIPPRIIAAYNLDAIVHDGYCYARIKKAWYGLKQAGKIAHDDLTKHLAAYGYHKTDTDGLWKHEWRDINFTLVVDDFGIKYKRREDVEHLQAALADRYVFKLDWDARQYLGITLEWDYSRRTLLCSMPGYVRKALKEFLHDCPRYACYAPSKMIRPRYGQRLQYAHVDDAAPLTQDEVRTIQKITGKFLFYARAIDATMLHALNDIATQTVNGTQSTMDAVKYFLNYCACNPDTSIMYRASDMVLRVDSDGAYLVAPKARSRAGGYHFLSNADGTTFNAPIYVLAKVLKHVTASAAETEIGAIYLNAREATIFRQTLADMGHPQQATPIKTDNTTARGIIDETMKAKYLKGADMRLNWMKDRVARGEFHVYWESAETNLADYPTKHHSPTHHRTVRPIWTHQPGKSPETMQGCVNILKGLAGVRHPTCYDELTSTGGDRPVPHPSDTSTSEHSNIARVNRITRLPRRYHSLFTRTPCGNDHYRPRSSLAKVREQALDHALSSTQDQCHDPTCSRSY